MRRYIYDFIEVAITQKIWLKNIVQKFAMFRVCDDGSVNWNALGKTYQCMSRYSGYHNGFWDSTK